MNETPTIPARPEWRRALPTLTGASLTLREPAPADIGALLHVLATAETASFGIEGGRLPAAIADLIARRSLDRQAGKGLLYLVTLTRGGRAIGLFEVRALDPAFETAAWEATMIPAVRGSGLFIEAAQLVAGFVFGTIGAHRLEARVMLENGRGNGAMRKLGATQEGVLRRALRRDGHYFDQMLWSLLRSESPLSAGAAGTWLH